MYEATDKLLTLEDLKSAQDIVTRSKLNVRRTPCILLRNEGGRCCSLFSENQNFNSDNWGQIWIKCENFQTTGSFKIRGLASQIEAFKKFCEFNAKNEVSMVTMSAGNYGRSFAFGAQQLGLSATVLMPDTAPDNREAIMNSFGAQVERMPSKDLLNGVKKHEGLGKIFLHPFDDINLIAGHGSLGLEILEDVPDVDVIVLCCGGGGLLAGVAAAIKLNKPSCKVFGVEPETANTMQRSLLEGSPVTMPSSRSIAAGLAPPFAGQNAFRFFLFQILVQKVTNIPSTVALFKFCDFRRREPILSAGGSRKI